MSTEEKVEGVVKWFNSEKGYGFVSRPDEKDIFVHFKSIIGDGFRTLQEGQKVSFSIENGRKGLEAKNVMVIK